MEEDIRIQNLISEAIRTLNLDLRGHEVLTEVGSNYFVVTPIIALMAGAKKVYAWTRDSAFGLGTENISKCKELIGLFNLDLNKIVFANNVRPPEHAASADIITNLGMVRPLDENLLRNLKVDAVIPLMCESWEFRKEDLDLNYCKTKEIKVAGTWENHPTLRIFDACGYLAAKLIFEAGFETISKIIPECQA